VPRGKLDKPTEPIHYILDALEELRVRLQYCGSLPTDADKKNAQSPIELYHLIVSGSEWGRACQYALKTQEMFRTHDQKDILNLVLKVVEAIRLLDPDFGR